MDKETAPVTVVAFRAESHSPDGKNLIISLRTKYSSAERKYSVPVECLKDFLVDLQRLQASKLDTQPNISIRMWARIKILIATKVASDVVTLILKHRFLVQLHERRLQWK